MTYKFEQGQDIFPPGPWQELRQWCPGAQGRREESPWKRGMTQARIVFQRKVHKKGKETLLGVDDIGSIGFNRGHTPDQEEAFGEPVERHLDYIVGQTSSDEAYPASNEVGKVLYNREEGEDDPVGEPLRIVVLHRALQGLDGAVGRVEEAHSVGQQLMD